MDKKEFMRQWGVDGMPADKIRLANAAWDDATKAEREACAKVCDSLAEGYGDSSILKITSSAQEECAIAIRMRSNV